MNQTNELSPMNNLATNGENLRQEVIKGYEQIRNGSPTFTIP